MKLINKEKLQYYKALAAYHTWRMAKALEIALRDNSKTRKQFVKEAYSKDLMKETLKYISSLPPEFAKREEPSWFVGVIPDDWEARLNAKIKEKEKTDVVD